MAIALEGVWLTLLLVAFYLAAKIILTPLIVGILRRVPIVGSLIARAAEAVVSGVETALAEWIRPHLATIVKWLKAAALATISPAAGLVYLGVKVEQALKHLVGEKISAMVHTVTNPIVRAVNRIGAAEAALDRNLAALDQRLTRGIEAGIRDLHDELLARFARGIDTLREDILGKVIPGLRADVARAEAALEAEAHRIAADVEGLGKRLADLARSLDIPLSLIETLIATVGIAAAVEALETLATCRGKLKTLCTSDPGAWADFIAGLALIAAWPGLYDLTRETQSILEDVMGELAHVVEHGL